MTYVYLLQQNMYIASFRWLCFGAVIYPDLRAFVAKVFKTTFDVN